MSSLSQTLSDEVAQFYANVFPSARAGCLNELRARGCTEEEAEELFAAANEKVMARVDPIERHFSPPQMVNYMKLACRRRFMDKCRQDRAVPKEELREGSGADEPGVDEVVENRELAAMSLEAVSTLSERDRRVLLLRAQGFDPDEICLCVSGLSDRAYRKVIGRANKRVQSELDAIERGGRCEEMENTLLLLHASRKTNARKSRQVTAHLERCRACRQAYAKIRGRSS